MTEAKARPDSCRPLVWSIYGAVWLFFVVKIVVYVIVVAPGVPPDERAHVSYAAYLAEANVVVPQVENMRLLSPTSGWKQEPSYLMHPPWYYHLVRVLPGTNTDAPTNPQLALALRWGNLWISLVAFTVMVYIGARLTMPALFHLLYAMCLGSIPMLSFGAAGVNNDSLALLAGALTVLGLCRWLEEQGATSAAVLIGVGVALALLAKLTVALLCCLMVAICLGWRVLAGRIWLRRSILSLVVIVTLAAPALSYHGIMVARYQTLLPSAAKLHNDTSRLHEFTLPGGERLSTLAWARWFVWQLGASWLSISSHRPHQGSTPLVIPGLLAVALLAVSALVQLARRGMRSVHVPHLELVCPVAMSAAAACVVVSLLHLSVTHQFHLQTGYMGGAQARYYFPLLPALLLLVPSLCARRRLDSGVRVFIVMLVTCLAVGDVASFLKILQDLT